jgi:outer membrane murein-binding lipoprotein Lpp
MGEGSLTAIVQSIMSSETALGLVAVVALALVLSGCGSSRKGNGYSAAPLTKPALSASASVSVQ